MSNPQTEQEVNIVDQFKEKIAAAGTTVADLMTLAQGKAKANNEAVTKIKELVGLLKTAIKKLKESQSKFEDVSRRIGLMNEEAQTSLEARISENKKSGNADCKKKINDLLKEFNSFVEKLNGIREVINSGATVELNEMGELIGQLGTIAEGIVASYSSIDGALPGTAQSASPRQSGSTPEVPAMFTMSREEAEGRGLMGRPSSAPGPRRPTRAPPSLPRPSRTPPPLPQEGGCGGCRKSVKGAGKKKCKTKKRRGGFRYGSSLRTITRKRTYNSRSKSKTRSKSKSKSKSRSKSRTKRSRSRSRRR